MVHSVRPSIELPNRSRKQSDATWVKRKEALLINTHRNRSQGTLFTPRTLLSSRSLESATRETERLRPRKVAGSSLSDPPPFVPCPGIDVSLPLYFLRCLQRNYCLEALRLCYAWAGDWCWPLAWAPPHRKATSVRGRGRVGRPPGTMGRGPLDLG